MGLKIQVIVFKYEHIMNVDILQSSICKARFTINDRRVYRIHVLITQSDFNIIIRIKNVRIEHQISLEIIYCYRECIFSSLFFFTHARKSYRIKDLFKRCN